MDTLKELFDNVDNIPIVEFMDAIGEKPVSRHGSILTYNAPYNIEELSVEHGYSTKGKPTCLVDTERNLWRDKKFTPWQKLTMLALEMTWSYNENNLKSFIAQEVFNHRRKMAAQNKIEQLNPKQRKFKM